LLDVGACFYYFRSVNFFLANMIFSANFEQIVVKL